MMIMMLTKGNDKGDADDDLIIIVMLNLITDDQSIKNDVRCSNTIIYTSVKSQR